MMDIAEAINLLEVIKFCDVDELKKVKAIDMAIAALKKQEKIKKDLKYYLDVNEENGVVYIPKFVIEKIVNNA